jgi:trigger factor
MKVDITKLPKSEIELKIQVPAEEWQDFFDEAAKELSRDLKIEGFRPGHAPSKMVEERIGSAKILEEAAEHCVRQCYARAILDNDMEAIGRPEISVTKIAKDNPFEFSARVAVMPSVRLPDYKKIAQEILKEKKEVQVSEEEIKKSIDWLQKSRTKYITVSRPASAGDRIEIDFEGSCEGKKMDELTSKNHPAILGRGYFLPGFEENLLGMEEREEKDFSLAFPADFEHKHLAGKVVNFKVKMNLVQEAELSEINDSFAQSLGNFKDLAALKESVKEGLLIEKQNQEKERIRAKMIAEIVKKSGMEMPDILIEAEGKRMKDDLDEKIKQIGLDLKQYLERFKKTEEEVKKEMQKNALERVEAFLVLRQIASQEKIDVSQQETEDEVKKALAHFQAVNQAETKVDTKQLKEYAKDVLKNEKVFQILESC